MSIAILCDPHVGDATHDEGGLRERTARFMLEDIDTSLSVRKPSMLVVAGDTFQNTKPPAWAYQVARDLRAICRKHGVPMQVLLGNHDAPKPNEVGPLEVIFDDRELVTSPRTLIVDGFTLTLFPWTSRARLAAKMEGAGAGEQMHAMSDLMRSIVQQERKRQADGTQLVAVTHFTIAGSRYNSDVQPNLGDSTELILPTNVFDGYDRVIAGHVHNRQQFADGLVLYPGSAARHDFGEEQSRPALHYITAWGEDESDDLTAVEFRTIDVTEQFDTAESNAYSTSMPITAGTVGGTVVRFRGELSAGPETADALAEFRAQALEAGAVKVTKPAIRFHRHEHREESTTTTATNPEEALSAYCEAVCGEYEANADALLEMHRELMSDVA